MAFWLATVNISFAQRDILLRAISLPRLCTKKYIFLFRLFLSMFQLSISRYIFWHFVYRVSFTVSFFLMYFMRELKGTFFFLLGTNFCISAYFIFRFAWSILGRYFLLAFVFFNIIFVWRERFIYYTILKPKHTHTHIYIYMSIYTYIKIYVCKYFTDKTCMHSHTFIFKKVNLYAYTFECIWHIELW